MKTFYYLLTVIIILPSSNILGEEINSKISQKEEEELSIVDNNRKNHKSKANFSFWFKFMPKKQRSMHMKVFDEMSIFNLDKEIESTLSNTKNNQNSFRKDIKLLDIQIDYCIDELKELLIEYQKGNNNSKEIVELYSTIFKLSEKKQKMIYNHSEQLIKILDNMSKQKRKHISKKIDKANEDPEALVNELLERYKAYQQ